MVARSSSRRACSGERLRSLTGEIAAERARRGVLVALATTLAAVLFAGGSCIFSLDDVVSIHPDGGTGGDASSGTGSDASGGATGAAGGSPGSSSGTGGSCAGNLAAGPWVSVNGALYQTVGCETQITSYVAYNHPVVTLQEDVVAGATDYTITGNFHGHGAMTEFGLIFGTDPSQPNEQLFATNYAMQDEPWFGTFPIDYNPNFIKSGSTYTLPISGDEPWDVQLVVHVSGMKITGQINLLSPQPGHDGGGPQAPAPLAAPLTYTATQSFAGSYVGFYTYNINPVTLTNLTVQ